MRRVAGQKSAGPGAPIYSRPRFLPPSRLAGTQVRDSLVADGASAGSAGSEPVQGVGLFLTMFSGAAICCFSLQDIRTRMKLLEVSALAAGGGLLDNKGFRHRHAHIDNHTDG